MSPVRLDVRTLALRLTRAGIAACAIVGLLSGANAAVSTTGGQPPTFDLVVANGHLIDGSGNPWVRRDIGIRGDTIAAVGDLRQARAARRIDARGRVVAPGFIDIHSHADGALASDHPEARRAASHVSQGITTLVAGSDGSNVRWPLTAEIDAYAKAGIGMNVVLMVGHNSLRRAVMGENYERPATSDEVARMAGLVRDGLRLGAWGLGAGLEYRPGRFSTTSEVIALAKVVAEVDGFYVAHQRSEATLPLWQIPSLIDGRPVDGLQGLEETIEIARQTGIRAVASHLKSRGRSSFGRSQFDTRLVDEARAAGHQVFIDVYSYDTFGSGPRIMIPAWSLVADGVDASGGEDSPVVRNPEVFKGWRAHLTRRWADPKTRVRIEQDIGWLVDHNGGADRVFVVDHADGKVVGKTIDELARARGLSTAALVIDLAMAAPDDRPGGALMRGRGMLESDVDHYIRQEYAATSSDAQVSGVPDTPFASRPGSHPRHFGAFTRKIAHYVNERRVVSLPFAVRSSTSLPAQIIGLTDRGLVREGFKADLIVFDEHRIRDRSTILEPALPSEGVDFVIVNGQVAVDAGKLTGTLAGRVLRRQGP